MAFKAAIFDFDGTLCDTIPDIAAAGNYALARAGFPTFEEREYEHFVGGGLYVLCRNFLPEGQKDDANVQKILMPYQNYYVEHSMDLTTVFPGIREMLDTLRAKGVRLGVLSNKGQEDTEVLCRHFFPGVFDLVRGAREGVPLKPDPTVPLAMADVFGLSPEEVVYVGDSGSDIRTARNAGMPSLGITWGYSKETMLAEKPDYIAETAADIAAIF